MNESALKNRMRILREETSMPSRACWAKLFLERFLVRLSTSEHANKFIFKGGFLLSYLMDIGRETVDLDFLLTRMKAEEKELQEIIEDILSVQCSDGFVFSFESIELLTQPHMDYPGYRIHLKGAYKSISNKIMVDVGVGDIVESLKRDLTLIHCRGKPLFESTVPLQMYPIEFIFSEKLETVFSKGGINSRMKDYHDLILMSRMESNIHPGKLKEATLITFSHRGTALGLIQFDQTALTALQNQWNYHLRGLGDMASILSLPKEIAEVIEELNGFIKKFLEAIQQNGETLQFASEKLQNESEISSPLVYW